MYCPIIRKYCYKERCAFFQDVSEESKRQGFEGVCLLACACIELEDIRQILEEVIKCK